MVCLWDWLPWSVSSTPCQPVSLCRCLCADGLPVAAGMCCLWWSVPSVLGVGRMCCLWPVDWWPWSVPSTPCQPVSLCRGVCVDGLPVACGLVAVVSVGVGCAACAVVSTLDTLPAVRVWNGLPVGLVAVVVSSLDTLPAVSLCRGLCVDGLPVAAGICCLCSWIGGRWDGVPVLVFILPQ